MIHSGNSLILKILVLTLLCGNAHAYTRQDSLRGGNGRGRDWWDVVRYDLELRIDTATKEVSGRNIITFRIVGEPKDSIQIDLQDSLEIGEYPQLWTLSKANPDSLIDEISFNDYIKEGSVWWITFDKSRLSKNQTYQLRLPFRGKPRTAKKPPWDGGFIWTKDGTGKAWIAVACQGLGASSWWPCKDYQGDEPDSGMSISINNVGDWEAGSNGKDVMSWQHFSVDQHTGIRSHGVKGLTWRIHNPINTYSTTFYIGDYAHWHDTLHGEKGILDLDFYSLRYNEAKARKQWTQAKEMLRCFEYWMGPYPFYEDGYKLVEAPYLGMEHQSAIAYGNGYRNGYNGRGLHIDRSGTGVGFSFDFIIIHESGHEWFGNSITAQDVADNWLHEGFTTYTETLFAEWIKGKDSAFAYAQGEWKNIKNDRPVIGDYGVNNEGSSDMYDKGAAVVHMIRMMINDDKRFRELLRGLNRDFYHKIVTSKEVEAYINDFMFMDLKPLFDQYLRRTTIPTLQWYVDKWDKLHLRWLNAEPHFGAPFLIKGENGKEWLFNGGMFTNNVWTEGEREFVIDYLPRSGWKIKCLGLYNIEHKQ